MELRRLVRRCLPGRCALSLRSPAQPRHLPGSDRNQLHVLRSARAAHGRALGEAGLRPAGLAVLRQAVAAFHARAERDVDPSGRGGRASGTRTPVGRWTPGCAAGPVPVVVSEPGDEPGMPGRRRGRVRQLPPGGEVRHESWIDPSFSDWLSARGIGFVNIDQPLFSRSVGPSARSTGRRGYVRVHGRNYGDWFRKGSGRDARYDYLYSEEELEGWAERAKEVARGDDVDEVDVVFNNHYQAQAVVNALAFRTLLPRASSTGFSRCASPRARDPHPPGPR